MYLTDLWARGRLDMPEQSLVRRENPPFRRLGDTVTSLQVNPVHNSPPGLISHEEGWFSVTPSSPRVYIALEIARFLGKI